MTSNGAAATATTIGNGSFSLKRLKRLSVNMKSSTSGGGCGQQRSNHPSQEHKSLPDSIRLYSGGTAA